MTVRRAIHTLWFIARPCDDVPGDWEAHCLDFDLVGQGQSLGEALSICMESAEIYVRESLRESRDPYATPAPPECWVYRNSILDAGEKLTAEQFSQLVSQDEDSREGERLNLILALECGVVVDIDFSLVDGAPPHPETDGSRPPLVWKKAA